MTSPGRVIYLDQSAKNLRFSLVSGSIDKGQLNILLSGALLLPGGYSLEAGIIGGSHYLQVIDERGTVLLTEVLACLHICDDGLTLGVAEFGSVRMRLSGLVYESDITMTSWPDGKERFDEIDRHVSDMPEKEEGNLGLRFRFPGVEEDGLPPLTTVFVRGVKENGCRSVTIDTVHAYPNELTLVFTKTKLTLEGGV